MTVVPIGTEFQRKVWMELKRIPSGETRTYKQVADSIGHPNSARAVANACAANSNPVEVPCHRVVRSDGRIGGYSGAGGVGEKRRLLELEKGPQGTCLEILEENRK
ncbi:MAG: hypothetical protein CMA88_01190 [Euryarchaeota archaeon]|nr:hypothetical protein [Euryarchaeota archaeon]